MKKRSIQHHIDTLGALLLFGLFAVSVLIVLLSGANAYRRLTERDQQAYLRRSRVQYLSARVRQADRLGGVSVEPFGEGEALVLTEEDGDYRTLVYCHGGWLMELYCAAETEMEPQDGERLLEAEGLALSLRDGLLTAVLHGTDGTEDALRLFLRSGRGSGA